ncbi:YbhB/YbcL family Raf kinase inhibitor-like protein [Bradyrhizobium ganzhouense]|uniref:YbhB/YbcL family Raf kinase inhibitor-like protein n=1 Tax=Bradyrhizobium ganzhouense TaxID=1179767 RepID=UPI003CF6C3D3
MDRLVNTWKTVAVAIGLSIISQMALGADAGLTVRIDDLDGGGRFADSAAFCPPGSGSNKDVSPGVSWSAGPTGTQSYVVLMTDPDVPQDFGLINKPGVTIPTEAPRISVFHWVLTDIPLTITSLAKGIESEKQVLGGKPVGPTSHGLRGANAYTMFFANVSGMSGTYGGYDGPCPPVNDERIHRYTIRVIALDVKTLGLTGAFDGEAVENAMGGHVLASGKSIATYTLNPALIKKTGVN